VLYSEGAPDLNITLIKGPVAFLKEYDAVFSNDRWSVVVNYDLDQFEAAVSTVTITLREVHELSKNSTSIGEFTQVEEALRSLGDHMRSIRQYLPRSLGKRGLFDVGGSALKLLFGIATNLDLSTLHETVDELHKRQDSVAHVIDSQMTYFKHLDETVASDHNIVTRLSSDIRRFAQATQASFQEVASKLEWGNKIRSMMDLTRQLEFTLLRLETRLGELLSALQQAVHRRVPVQLIPPYLLERILTNVSLGLPENFNLIKGLQDLPFYYEYIETGVMATKKGILLSLSIPLREVNTQFEVFRIFMFPTVLLNHTYIQFDIHDTYLAVNMAQRAHISLSAEYVSRCTGPEDFKICPSDCAILTTEVKTCAMSIYLQTDSLDANCDRRVYPVRPSHTLLRHGATVVYYCPIPQRVFFRCRRDVGWETTSVELHGAGLIEGASSCHVSTEGLHLRPVFRSRTSLTVQPPQIYLPKLQILASSSEMEVVQQFVDSSFFEGIDSPARTPTSMADLTARYKMKNEGRSRWTTWLLPCISASATVVCLYILYIILTPFHAIFRQPWHYCVHRKLPVKDNVDLAVQQIQTPDQGQLEAPASVASITGPDNPSMVAVEPAPRYVRH